MKNLFIFALFFVVVNSSFLRQLESITISEATLKEDCVVQGTEGKAMELTLKAGAAVTKGADDSVFTVTLSGKGEAEIEEGCTLADDDKTKFTCVNDLADVELGTYTLKSLVETTETEGITVNTFTLGDGVSAVFIVAEDVTLAAEQETAQTVDLKDDEKKSFKIALDATTPATAAPAIYAGSDAKTPLSACTLSEDAKTVTCNPTAEEMKDGQKYKIHYNKGCTKTDSGIEVTFKNGSVFMTVSKIALIALALLF